MAITLRQLSYFTALADEGSFGRAAARVHVSQPALSVQIQALEESLAAPLVERLPRGIRLTRAGHEVAEKARRILAEVVELEATARRQGFARRINLGVIPTVAPYLMPMALQAIRSADITQDMRLHEAQTARLIEALNDGRIDAAVIATPPPQGRFVSLPLFEDRFLLAGTEARLDRLAASRDALKPSGIDSDQLLLLDEGHCLADQALEACAFERRQRRLDLGASSLSTLCGLVGQGFGLTFLPEIAAATEQAAVPTMALARFGLPEPSRTVLLVGRASGDDDEWFRDLAALLSEAGQAIVDAMRR